MSDWTRATSGAQLFWAPIPAYSAIPLLVFFMHMRLWTFLLALAVCVVLAVLRLKGRKPGWIVRRTRSRLRSGGVQARTIWYRRAVQDIHSLDVLKID